MKPLTQIFCSLVYGSAIVACTVYAVDSWRASKIEDSIADIAVARQKVKEAEVLLETTKYTAINAYIQLETMRTDVEKANRKALMAEAKLAAVCRKKKVC